MMYSRLKFSSLLCFLILLTACSSSVKPVATKYYLLDADIQVKSNSNNLPVMALATIDMPSYLKNSNLVMLASNNELVPANFHKWADALNASISRALISDLNQVQDKVHFVGSCASCAHFKVEVQHFYPSEKGKVILRASYHLPKEDSAQHHGFSSDVELEKDGYAHSVEMMRQQIKRLAEDIAQKL